MQGIHLKDDHRIRKERAQRGREEGRKANVSVSEGFFYRQPGFGLPGTAKEVDEMLLDSST